MNTQSNIQNLPLESCCLEDLAAAKAGSSDSVDAATLVELFFEAGFTLEEVGLEGFSIGACGRAHRDNTVVIVDFVNWGEECEDCHSEFRDSFAEAYGKDLKELIASGHPQISRL